jgi:hypothetical protein
VCDVCDNVSESVLDAIGESNRFGKEASEFEESVSGSFANLPKLSRYLLLMQIQN